MKSLDLMAIIIGGAGFTVAFLSVAYTEPPISIYDAFVLNEVPIIAMLGSGIILSCGILKARRRFTKK